jgi:hypothetical protein
MTLDSLSASTLAIKLAVVSTAVPVSKSDPLADIVGPDLPI